ncbi:MAG TPA: uroporphyrinogen-III synthase [Pyrinomonadaceae bacterium]|nr:uroporphyrinogen-III synthase [Pyrinomonadaceae bacterium]
MKVIVARADDNFSQMLREADIEVINLELIRTEVLDDLSEFENQISRLDEYDGVFFTSPVAARVFADHVEPRLKPMIYALGARATKVLVDAGFAVRTVAAANTAEEMLDAFGDDEFAGKKLLFVRGERSMRTIPEKLAAIADVDEVAVYRTVEIESTDHDLSAEAEWICFFSPSAVEAFEKRFGNDLRVAALGETTAARAGELKFSVGLVASKATNDAFAAELIETLRTKREVH